MSSFHPIKRLGQAVHSAVFVGSGNAVQTVFNLSHGIGNIPTGISVEGINPNARGDFDVSGTASGIVVTYAVPPASGTIQLTWIAGPSNILNIPPVVHAGTFVGSGNASTTVYNISHGIQAIPTGISVEGVNPNARGPFDVSGTASGIIVTYPFAPSSGDVILTWIAGPSNVASQNVVLSGQTVHTGTFVGSGNALTTVYTLSHGMQAIPAGVTVNAGSPQARGNFDISGNMSGIFVTYPFPPSSGNVILTWVAGPSTVATQDVLLSGHTVHTGTFVGSGNTTTTIYQLSHGCQSVPTGISVEPGSPQARGSFDVSGNASGIIVTYPMAPASGDVILSWIAGPSNVASVGTMTLVSGVNFSVNITSGALAGSLGALPATTAGFIQVLVSGNPVKIPFFL